MKRPWQCVREAWRKTETLVDDRDVLRVWVNAFNEVRAGAIAFIQVQAGRIDRIRHDVEVGVRMIDSGSDPADVKKHLEDAIRRLA